MEFDEEVAAFEETKGVGASDVTRAAFADFLSDKFLCRKLDQLGSSFLVKSVRKEVVRKTERLGAPAPRPPTPPPRPATPPTPPPREGLDGTEWKESMGDMRDELDEFEGRPGKRFDHLGDHPWTCKVRQS